MIWILASVRRAMVRMDLISLRPQSLRIVTHMSPVMVQLMSPGSSCRAEGGLQTGESLHTPSLVTLLVMQEMRKLAGGGGGPSHAAESRARVLGSGRSTYRQTGKLEI